MHYLVSAELRNEIVGGRCALTMTAGGFPSKTVQFYIRGKNPLDAAARAYIDANVDPEFRSFAWMIAKHESCDVVTGRVYNQFNASGKYKELPNHGAPDGWGMCQIDRSGNRTGIRYTTGQRYHGISRWSICRSRARCIAGRRWRRSREWRPSPERSRAAGVSTAGRSWTISPMRLNSYGMHLGQFRLHPGERQDIPGVGWHHGGETMAIRHDPPKLFDGQAIFC